MQHMYIHMSSFFIDLLGSELHAGRSLLGLLGSVSQLLAGVTLDLALRLEEIVPLSADTLDDVVLVEHLRAESVSLKSRSDLSEGRVGRKCRLRVVVGGSDVLEVVSVEPSRVEASLLTLGVLGADRVQGRDDLVRVEARGRDRSLRNSLSHGDLLDLAIGTTEAVERSRDLAAECLVHDGVRTSELRVVRVLEALSVSIDVEQHRARVAEQVALRDTRKRVHETSASNLRASRLERVQGTEVARSGREERAKSVAGEHGRVRARELGRVDRLTGLLARHTEVILELKKSLGEGGVRRAKMLPVERNQLARTSWVRPSEVRSLSGLPEGAVQENERVENLHK